LGRKGFCIDDSSDEDDDVVEQNPLKKAKSEQTFKEAVERFLVNDDDDVCNAGPRGHGSL
jgi:hypothetical protein